MKAVIYEKFGAVLQMKYFAYSSVPSVFAVKCVVYGWNDSNEIERHFVVEKQHSKPQKLM